jgi:putative PIN family toxin of toxin-antitoxin system
VARYRAVIDVNVVVSALISTTGAPGQILDAVQQGEVTLIVCPAFLAEIHDVLHRPKFRRWFPVAVASRMVVEIRRGGETHPDPPETVALTRDPSDDYLARLARAARADCLVTGDGDLIAADLADVWVLSPGEFLDELRS